MDYCAKESTLPQCGDVCEREVTTSEVIRDIRKELAETISVLSAIRLMLEGEETPERKIDEPKCLHEEVRVIERMAIDCMGLSHVISDRLFGSAH